MKPKNAFGMNAQPKRKVEINETIPGLLVLVFDFQCPKDRVDSSLCNLCTLAFKTARCGEEERRCHKVIKTEGNQ